MSNSSENRRHPEASGNASQALSAEPLLTSPENFSRSRFFLSLKWKSALVVSLALVAVNISLSLIAYIDQSEQFKQQRLALHQRYDEELRAIVQFKGQSLILAGDLIPRLSGITEALDTGSVPAINQALERHWPTFRFDLGIDRFLIFSEHGEPMLAWGGGEEYGEAEAVLRTQVERVGRTLQPIADLVCIGGECSLMASLPALANQNRLIMVLQTPMSDIVASVSRITGVDTGILLPADHRGHHAEEAFAIAAWGVHVAALSNKSANQSVITELASRVPLEQILGGNQHVRQDGRVYEVRVLPLERRSSTRGPYWIAIDDITASIDAIEAAKRKSLLTSALGVILSVLLLATTLWEPMVRLNRISQILPVLADRGFGTARQRLTREVKSGLLGDEIDLLKNTAIGLSHQLESLENQVSERIQELQSQRDFVTGLMDATDVLVLTQGPDLNITFANPYAKRTIGLPSKELLGKSYLELICDLEDHPDLEREFHALVMGELRTIRHEALLCGADGSRLTLGWVHSRLEQTREDDPQILSVALDLTKRKQAENRLAWLANHDPLTKLYNRRRFQQELDRTLTESLRVGRPGVLLYLDVDHFKDINDSSGHQAGDALMVQIAGYLRHSLRAVDVLGRLGGDEFAVILADTTASDASRIVEKISAGLAEQEFSFDEQGYRISLTTGITTFPADGTTVPELLANADMAMYQAKETGRGGYHRFTAADQSRERLHTRMLWKERIDAALGADGFVLHYQPILDIRSGQVNHFEVLVRMLGDGAQLQFPGQFIPVAEQTGQIRRIDQWVLNKAIRHLVQVVDRDPEIRFSINLSGGTFSDPSLFPFLDGLLREVGLDPCHVILEITETAAVADMTAARRTVETLTELGCQFALDDFGVGFTSFAYLKQLPVDYIKIDGAFIRNLSKHSDDRFLVKAMAEVANGLGKKTVAEFVEQEACLDLLRRFGVDFAQGYFIGRPAPWSDEVLALPVATQSLQPQTDTQQSGPKSEGGTVGTPPRRNV